MRDLYRDAQKVILSLLAGLLLYVVVIGGLPFGAGFAAGWFTKSPKIVALTDTIRLTDSILVTRTDTVVKYQRRVDTVRAKSDSLDSLVVIVDSVTVRVADTVAVVPSEVIADLSALRLTVATLDTLNRAHIAKDSTRVWQLETRDRMIRELSKPQLCGRRCGFLLGAATVAGFVYLVK
jgi:hypothetical protein